MALSHARDAENDAHRRAYVSLAVKGSGLLALSLSTVVLLGGYVQSLVKEDFFCIIAITTIQAAGIFKEFMKSTEYLVDFVFTALFLMGKLLNLTISAPGCLPLLLFILLPVLYAPLIAILCIELIYLLGPFACAAISSWRIAKLNHGDNMDGSDSVVDMVAAMNLFYSLIIFQGAMFGVLLVTVAVGRRLVTRRIHALEKLPEEWGRMAIHRYLFDISAKCRKDPVSTKGGMDLIKYAAELLDSESQQDYLFGARLLSAFITKGKGGNVRQLLLPSGHKIQKLIDSLWITSCLDENTEIRELAATIMAHLAGHIDIAKYPEAMRYISSLFQENRMQMIREELRQQSKAGGTSNQLILQGLTILERLASNDDNRRIIRGTLRLLAKITTPVYSATLIEDVKTKAWAEIVTRCLKVLYQLIRAPDGSHEIFSNNVQALSNLKSILLEVGSDEASHQQELQLVAMKILTELVTDPSTNLSEETKKVLVKKQLRLFLLANGDDEEESTTIAGRAMVSLSTNSESNSVLIMTTENGIIGRLSGILDDDNITRRTIAAEIMVNLCAHCNVDNTMKQILLPKVLRKIMSIKIKSEERIISAGQNNSASGDEENQGNSASKKNEEKHSILHLLRSLLLQQSPTGTEEISDQEREEQEAFLSLAQVICDKLDSADLDAAIQNSVQNENNAETEEERRRGRREAFVDRLKTIIDGNRHATTDCLRIVKLCGQIAKSVMRCEQYAEIFRNRGFKSSLSEASKTMSELESCMLFVGTDFGLRKAVRPLVSEIEKTWPEM